ncbi:hypothetical protein [Cysteiniphilum halobium]|uniref:hypothetical protein n=1 Tax=Cysteiniphilum halobium TaxID=2219059 RepID=UPI000E64E0DE|nr:hypothetical protein [Cysteiniphilum halobium]
MTMKTKELDEKTLGMIRYAVMIKASKISEELSLSDTRLIQSMLIKFIDLICESYSDIIRYLPRLNFKLNFNFDELNFHQNKSTDDEVLTAYLEKKMTPWQIRADQSDFFEQAIALKVKKIQQGTFLSLSEKMLNNSLKAYIKNELNANDGTILSLLMHLKYVSPVLTFDIKDFDCLPTVDQIKISRALRSLEIN